MTVDGDADHRGPGDLRGRIEALADEFGVEDVGDLLIQSKRRDPMWKGTDADHAKAAFFAEWWKNATEGRDDAEIHVRGVHYYMVSVDDEITPPTSCSWTEYQNTDRCYGYLEECALLARILGYIPLGGIVDNKHDQMVVTHYGRHTTKPELHSSGVPTGISRPEIPHPDARTELRFDPEMSTVEDGIGGSEGGGEGVEDPPLADFLAESLASALREQLRFDRARQAPFHLELWSEKSLPDYIHEVARDMGVNVVVEGEGDLSLTIAHDLVKRIDEAGKPAVILYLSDYDPKGDNMASAMSGKLAWLNERGDVNHRVVIEQLAVTREQIEALGLPRQPIEESAHTGTGGRAYDTLVDDWERRRGVGATELNALEAQPDEFRRIVREGVAPYVDERLGTKNEDARDQWEHEVEAAIRAAVDGADLDDALDILLEWANRYDDALEDARPVLEELRGLANADELNEWRDAVRDTVSSAEIPRIEPPVGEGAFPDDPLFDSDRAYEENVVRVQRHKQGE